MISSISNIIDNIHKCDSGIYALSCIQACISEYMQLSDLFENNEPERFYNAVGSRISDLKYSDRILNSDLFLIERKPEARKLTYADLLNKIKINSIAAAGVGDMAFESKYKYAKISHVHDDLYTFFDISCAQFPIKSTIANFKIYNNGETDQSDMRIVNINFPEIPIQPPPEPDIGTIKLIYLKHGEIRKSNIELTSSQNFDGWVYADGSEFLNVDAQRFKKAIEKFGNGRYFKVPNLSGFFKLSNIPVSDISKIFPQRLSPCPQHTHIVDEAQMTGSIKNNDSVKLKIYTDPLKTKKYPTQIHHGVATTSYSAPFTVNAAQLTLPNLNILEYVPQQIGDGKFRPNRQRVYSMIYIGGLLNNYAPTDDIYIDFIFRDEYAKINTLSTYVYKNQKIYANNNYQVEISKIEYPYIKPIEGYKIRWSSYELSNISKESLSALIYRDIVISARYVFDDSFIHEIENNDEIIDVDSKNEIDSSDIRLLNVDNILTYYQTECLNIGNSENPVYLRI